jgi:hypothetical protein
MYYTRRERRNATIANTIAEIIASAVTYLIITGFVWLFAWMTNPEFTSGTIWFFALVASCIVNALRPKVKDSL